MASDVPPEEHKKKRVFISYGHDDLSAFAARLKADLLALGYEVWFDADRIWPGDEWERSIEEGLNWVSRDKNGVFLLLMTPRSVRRPDGYCLNELASAIHHFLRIMPVMIVWCEPPLSICRIQWLDMQDCVPLEQREDRYRERLRQLAEALDTGRVDVEGFQSALASTLQPLSYEAEIRYNLDRFTGREWLLAEIDRWLESGKSRVFWIMGNPGVGKTAISAWLCAHKREIAAFHFCRYDNVQKADPRRCVMSLAFQLSTQLPEYLERLKTVKLEEVDRLNAKTLFDHLIVQPMYGIGKPDRPVVMLIDALDEATAGGKNELASFISSELERTPSWLRLIVTSRPDSEVTGLLQAYQPFRIDVADPRNREDIRTFLKRELGRLDAHKGLPDGAIEAILGKSEGSFLYAEWVLWGIASGRLSLAKVDEFPQGLGSVYLRLFERQFPDVNVWDARVRPMIEAIAALQVPLDIGSLWPLFGWTAHDDRFFRRSLGSLFSFEDGVAQPFHKSVMEWLTQEDKQDPYYVSVREGHRLLAGYGWKLYMQGLRSPSSYFLMYLPTHLLFADMMPQLREALADLTFLRPLWGQDKFSVLRQWVLAEERSSLRMADVYEPYIWSPEKQDDKDLHIVADLLEATYHIDEAFQLLGYLVSHYRHFGDPAGLQKAIGSLAWVYYIRGDFDHAMELLKEQEQLCREIENIDGLQYSIRNQASILCYRNDFEAALLLYKEQERICRDSGNWNGLQESLGDQCLVLRVRGDYDGVLRLVEERMKICRDIGNMDGMQQTLCEEGLIFMARGDLGKASSLFAEQERICREIGNKIFLPVALGCQAKIFMWKGDLDIAMALNKEQGQILRAIGNKYGLQETIRDQAINCRIRGDLPGAEALLEEMEQLCRELGDKYGLQVCSGERGIIARLRGDLDGAMALFGEQERICREIGHRRDLALCQSEQAVVLRLKGDLPAALALHDEAAGALREIGFQYGLQIALGQKAMTLFAAGDRDGALTLLKERGEICRKMGAKIDLAECLKDQETVKKAAG